jgi:16S rRNA (guanine1207-N2)-methyltransferase
MSADHYFSEKPAARGGRRVIATELRGFSLRLATEAGVFSRDRVDRGTRLLIKHLDVRPDDRILDLGCGSGVVGIVAALLAPRGRVVLVDINSRAVEVARRNLVANRIGNAEVLHGDGFAPVHGRSFDLIAFNPPVRAGLATVHRLTAQARDHLALDGRFYLVGRTKQGVIRLSQKISEVFGQVCEVAKGGGFRLYRARHADSESS